MSKGQSLISYCSNCLVKNELYDVKMSFILKWKGDNPKNPEFEQLMIRIWGEDIVKHLDTACKDINWLGNTTKFCDACFLKATKLQTMTKDEIKGLKITKRIRDKLEKKAREKKNKQQKRKRKLGNSKNIEGYDTIGGGFGDYDMSLSSVESSNFVGMAPNSKMNFSMNMDRAKLQSLMSEKQTTMNSRNSLSKLKSSQGEKKSKIRIGERELTILQPPQTIISSSERQNTHYNNFKSSTSKFQEQNTDFDSNLHVNNFDKYENLRIKTSPSEDLLFSPNQKMYQTLMSPQQPKPKSKAHLKKKRYRMPYWRPLTKSKRGKKSKKKKSTQMSEIERAGFLLGQRKSLPLLKSPKSFRSTFVNSKASTHLTMAFAGHPSLTNRHKNRKSSKTAFSPRWNFESSARLSYKSFNSSSKLSTLGSRTQKTNYKGIFKGNKLKKTMENLKSYRSEFDQTQEDTK